MPFFGNADPGLGALELFLRMTLILLHFRAANLVTSIIAVTYSIALVGLCKN